MNRFFLAAALLAAALFSATPDLYDRDRPLHSIETTWFDFIFPEESTAAARYLASFADDLYVEVAALLGTQPRHRLPVVLTPDHEWINGYFTNYPYLRIVLYHAAIDMTTTLGSFKDDLRSLFMHELTHAVSLTIRGPVQDVLTAIFGSPLGLSMYTTPLNFVEGVTVSFESLGGFGRTTDPLAGALIRQDLLEGKFKSFTQTMGTWDRFPGRTLYYIYGGYFSRYLQDRFGMEKYALLWQRLGSGMLTRPLDDFLFIQGHFRKVYGLSLRDAWAEFGESMRLQTEVLESGPKITGLSSIDSLAAGGSFLFWADSAKGAVFVHDTRDGQTRKVFPTGATITRLDPDRTGSRVLVSATGYEDGYARLSIREWDDASGTLTRLSYNGLRDASYPSGGSALDTVSESFLAIQVQGYVTSVVLARDGNIHPLLTGSERIAYSSPVTSMDGWIYVLAKEDGRVSVLRFQLNGTAAVALQRLRLPLGLGWIRYLSLEDGILRFSWDDAAFYRLAELNGDVLGYQTTPVSGGMHQTVGLSGSMYYLGHFSEGTAVCTLPTDRDRLGFLEVQVDWEPAEYLMESTSMYRPLEETPENSNPTGALDIRPYTSLPWLLPRFWHPIVAGDADGLTLVGAALYFADPIERISGYVSGGWNPRTQTPGYSTGLDLDLSPLLLRFTAGDGFSSVPSDLHPDQADRLGSAGFSLARTIHPFSGGTVDLGISGTVQGWARSSDETERYGDWDLGLFHANLYAGLQDMKQISDRPGLRMGYSVGASVRGIGIIVPASDGPQIGFEIQAAWASRFLGFELAGYGGLSLSQGLLYGPAGAMVQTGELGDVSIPAYPGYVEFTDASAGTWHMQAEASLRPFSSEIQESAGPLYARRLNLRAGSRAILAGGTDRSGDGPGFESLDFNWSIFSRLELAFSPAIGSWALARPVAWVELWYKPLDETWGLGYVRELVF